MKIQKAVAMRISNLLNMYKISQYELAKRMITGRTTIMHIINEDYKNIKFETLVKIADAFNLTIQQFLDDPLFDKNNLEFN